VTRRNAKERPARRTRSSMLSMVEALEPRAMLAGVGPESWSVPGLAPAPLGTGLPFSSGMLLTCSSPTPGSSRTSSLPAPTLGTGGSQSTGLALPSNSGSGIGSSPTGSGSSNAGDLALPSNSGSGAGSAPTGSGSSNAGGLALPSNSGSGAGSSNSGAGSNSDLKSPVLSSQYNGGSNTSGQGTATNTGSGGDLRFLYGAGSGNGSPSSVAKDGSTATSQSPGTGGTLTIAELWRLYWSGAGAGSSSGASNNSLANDPTLSAKYTGGSGGGQVFFVTGANGTIVAGSRNQQGSGGSITLTACQSTGAPGLLETTSPVASLTHAVQIGTPTVSYVNEQTAGAFDMQWQLAGERPRNTLYHGIDPAEVTWTAEDRQAAIRAQGAYAFDGGLLKEFGIPYRPKDGFSASLFAGSDGTFYLAFRGTEPTSWEDWWADLMQGGGYITSQYEQALDLVRNVLAEIERRGGRLIVTGHSLGGGLALASSYAYEIDAIVFNPATSNDWYSDGTPGDIRSHIVAGDILSVGRTLGHMFQLPVLRLRSAPGLNVIYPPTQPNTHGMDNFPIDDRIDP